MKINRKKKSSIFFRENYREPVGLLFYEDFIEIEKSMIPRNKFKILDWENSVPWQTEPLLITKTIKTKE
jgi:hypothetical protein